MYTLLRSTTAIVVPRARSLGTQINRFARDDSGVLEAPTLIFAVLMLAVGGLGVDLMRLERDRTLLQYTMDRAVLAAADLDQPLSPPEVVEDYLTKAGLGDYYQEPTFDSGIGYRWVEGTIDTTFPVQYMKLAGGDDLPLSVTSRAEESIDSVEISLVLDVSGSMNSTGNSSSYSRLYNLKVAAKAFVDTLSANTEDGKMSMSIVPYATQVSGSSEFMDQFNLTDEHQYSNCVNFTGNNSYTSEITDPNDPNSTVDSSDKIALEAGLLDGDFATPSISTTEELERTMHFTPWSSYDRRTNSTPRLVSSPVCEADASREMLVLQKDPDDLKTFIGNLWAGGNTSIDLGMKWGTALLDPSTRPAIAALSSGTDASVPAVFSERPADYTDGDTLKIIVLMTDGQNTSQYYIEDDHRRGDSDVWYNSYKKNYSTLNPSTGKYYWHHNNSYWHSVPYGESSSHSGTAERLSYADLWAYTPLKYVYRYLYDDWMSNSAAKSTWYYGVYDSYGNSTKNNRTQAICDAAKAQGIIVYTIGFEAPTDGQRVLKACASSPAHYQNTSGSGISDAFASIATSIRQLRLTQ